MPKKILITEEVPEFFLKELLSAGFETTYKPDISSDELKNILHNFHVILIRSRITLDENLLSVAENLEIILRPGSGLDIIDTETARRKNIIILNSPEGNRNAVGEHTVGLLLSIFNNIPSSFSEVKCGKWDRKKNKGTEIRDKIIGIIGFGNTGSSFAEKISSFGAKILAYDKFKTGYAPAYVTETTMEVIFNEADIVSFHIPLSTENTYLVNKNYLEKFRKPITLINTSRGKIANTKDLLWGIENGILTNAALDVLENEKLSSYNTEEKNVFDELIKTGKVLITPHIAGVTTESEYEIFSVLLKKILKYNHL